MRNYAKCKTSARQPVIDAFRAIAMILMIFVNDLWTLTNVPQVLQHAAASEDRLGFADIVFPMFLFIVGASIPFAMRARVKKGDTKQALVSHILKRSISLIIMSFFLVNGEAIGAKALIPGPYWHIILIVAFFLIWNKTRAERSVMVIAARCIGVVLLLILTQTYGDAHAAGPAALSIRWWGILGMIGWAYMICSLIFVYSEGRFTPFIPAFVLFLTIVIANQLQEESAVLAFLAKAPVPGGAANVVFCLAGVCSTYILRLLRSPDSQRVCYLISAIVCIVCGISLRQFGGISKIYATPSWVLLSTGLCFIMLLLIRKIPEWFYHSRWYQAIRPAGAHTLTCYLLPYLHYALLALFLPQLPELFRSGITGLGKSLIYSLLIVWIAGLLSKKGIEIKL